jgi:hypothetical protein
MPEEAIPFWGIYIADNDYVVDESSDGKTSVKFLVSSFYTDKSTSLAAKAIASLICMVTSCATNHNDLTESQKEQFEAHFMGLIESAVNEMKTIEYLP